MAEQHFVLWQEALGNPMSLIGFLLCVVVAAYAQTLTGFALGLILLSIATAFDLASISDAANTAMVLSLISAYSFFRVDRRPPPWRLIRPALISSLCSVVLGVALLLWLSTNAAQSLKIVLGVVITGCAVALALQKQPKKAISSPIGFGIAGSLSGLLGGLFGTSGPPIVYFLCRQPLDSDIIRRALLVIFASNAFLRLVAVIVSGNFTARALLLCVLSVPIVHIVTTFTARRPPPVSAATMKIVISSLLALSGVLLMLSGL